MPRPRASLWTRKSSVRRVDCGPGSREVDIRADRRHIIDISINVSDNRYEGRQRRAIHRESQDTRRPESPGASKGTALDPSGAFPSPPAVSEPPERDRAWSRILHGRAVSPDPEALQLAIERLLSPAPVPDLPAPARAL